MSTPTQEPYNLSSATITGNTSAMTISWDHNTTNTVNYTLQYSWYDDNYSGATAPDVTVVANQTSYSAVISELELGRKYYIKVTAVGTGGSLQSSSRSLLSAKARFTSTSPVHSPSTNVGVRKTPN